MIIGTGIDITEIQRITKIYHKFGNKFLNKIFTKNEINICNNINAINSRIAKYAKRFAAKEACLKAIGTGVRGNCTFLDIEITNDQLGKPLITVSEEIKKILFKRIGKNNVDLKFHLSLSDTCDLAQAMVIIEC